MAVDQTHLTVLTDKPLRKSLTSSVNIEFTSN